jgi:hypothetical protein
MNGRYDFSVPITWRVCCHFLMNAGKNCKKIGVSNLMRKHNQLKRNYSWKWLSDRTKNFCLQSFGVIKRGGAVGVVA